MHTVARMLKNGRLRSVNFGRAVRIAPEALAATDRR
jgi:excisionase family DNA binding protein